MKRSSRGPRSRGVGVSTPEEPLHRVSDDGKHMTTAHSGRRHTLRGSSIQRSCVTMRRLACRSVARHTVRCREKTPRRHHANQALCSPAGAGGQVGTPPIVSMTTRAAGWVVAAEPDAGGGVSGRHTLGRSHGRAHQSKCPAPALQVYKAQKSGMAALMLHSSRTMALFRLPSLTLCQEGTRPIVRRWLSEADACQRLSNSASTRVQCAW